MSSHAEEYTGNGDVVMDKARSRDELVQELITLITQAVNLKHVDKSSLNADTLLARPRESSPTAEASSPPNSLGLDSIDILEAVVVVEHHYRIKVEDASQGEHIFKTFGTIADFILSR